MKRFLMLSMPFAMLVSFLAAASVNAQAPGEGIADRATAATETHNAKPDMENAVDKITLGAGCFWCVEAVFQRIEGVVKVESGYMGGRNPNPTYKQICTGMTGHAEVIQVTFDPAEVLLDDLLKVFWQTHDPTTLNRQGADVGTQYRSAVFYHNDQQRERAELWKEKLNAARAFASPIVTEISPATEFYVAEDYHQNYFNLNQSNPYCRAVIPSKLKKLKKVFGEGLKEEYK